MRFRKKPVEIDATCIRRDNIGTLHAFLREDDEVQIDVRRVVVHIRTLEGVMTAREGDWLIRGVAGELYPCKPEIFDATYEPAA